MIPLKNKIQLKIDDVKIGAIQSDTVAEKGTVVAVGAECKPETKELVGKTIYFKAWAVDVITDNGEKFYFISEDSDALCGIL